MITGRPFYSLSESVKVTFTGYWFKRSLVDWLFFFLLRRNRYAIMGPSSTITIHLNVERCKTLSKNISYAHIRAKPHPPGSIFDRSIFLSPPHSLPNYRDLAPVGLPVPSLPKEFICEINFSMNWASALTVCQGPHMKVAMCYVEVQGVRAEVIEYVDSLPDFAGTKIWCTLASEVFTNDVILAKKQYHCLAPLSCTSWSEGDVSLFLVQSFGLCDFANILQFSWKK